VSKPTPDQHGAYARLTTHSHIRDGPRVQNGWLGPRAIARIALPERKCVQPRLNNWNPCCVSSSVICLLRADCVIRSRCAARVKFSSSAKITTEYKCRTSTWGSIGLKPSGHEYLEFPELPHIYIRNLRTEKSMNKNFWSVYGFYSHQKEVVCLDAPDFSMAGYSHGSAGVS